MLLSLLSSLLLFSTSSAVPQAAKPQLPAPAMVTSCGEVTRPQIEAAIGLLLTDGAEEQSKFTSTCRYSAGDVEVTISIQHLTQSLNLTAELETLRKNFPGAGVREIAGIAEHAYALEIPDAGTQLHVLPGDREYFMVSVLGLGAGHHGFDAAAKIAQAVMNRR